MSKLDKGIGVNKISSKAIPIVDFFTHNNDVAWPVLDGAEEAEDDDDDVEEVGEDWGPLVSQEVEDLPL